MLKFNGITVGVVTPPAATFIFPVAYNSTPAALVTFTSNVPTAVEYTSTEFNVVVCNAVKTIPQSVNVEPVHEASGVNFPPNKLPPVVSDAT